MVGAAIAAYTGGALHDFLGNYNAAFVSAALLGFIAAGLAMQVETDRTALVSNPAE